MSELRLKDVEWKEFRIENIFEIQNTKPYHKNYLSKVENKGIPYITRTSLNNGFDSLVQFYDYELVDKNTISFGAENANFFYQPYSYIVGNKMYTIKSEHLNKYNSLFIIRSLKESIKDCGFGFGRGLTGTRLKNRNILLPCDSNGKPYWNFMTNYMKEQEAKLLKETIGYYETKILNNLIVMGDLSDVKWKEFMFDEVFTEIRRGKRLAKKDQREGNIPYISSKGMNNGIDNFISNKEDVRVYEDCLTVANSGSVGSCFYHQYEFIASDHVTHLKNEDFDKYIYLFMVPIVRRLEEKYSFNREINDTRIRKEKLLLPINDSGEINFDFMRNFMKYMEVNRLNKVLKMYKNKIDKKITGGGGV